MDRVGWVALDVCGGMDTSIDGTLCMQVHFVLCRRVVVLFVLGRSLLGLAREERDRYGTDVLGLGFCLGGINSEI